MTGLKRTEEALSGSMVGLTKCLSFTMETEEDFQDGWLPTLDMKLKVSDNNQILYTFYEKPTASKMCLQTDTALGQDSLVQSLVNDVMRRMGNTSEQVDISVRHGVVDDFAQKMLNSGHSLAEVRRNLISGLKGYERKLAASRRPRGPSMNKSAEESSGSRRLKKLTGKSSWFKSENKNLTGGHEDVQERQVNNRAVPKHSVTFKHQSPNSQEYVPHPTHGGGKKMTHPEEKTTKRQPQKNRLEMSRAAPHLSSYRTASVMFVEQTKGEGA
jgi:hypothetical protein